MGKFGGHGCSLELRNVVGGVVGWRVLRILSNLYIAPMMHPRQQASVPRSRAEWIPMRNNDVRMDAGHSVTGLPEAQYQYDELLPLQL